MKITSSQFENNQSIPDTYTCDVGPRGAGTNPPLEFGDIPENTVSLVLTMHDPDVPTEFREDGNWDHWLIWNIDPSTTKVLEGTEPEGNSGLTTSETHAYVGPCPPDKEHRYYFRLYALDTTLELDPNTTRRAELEAAMEGHILEQVELMGTYNRKENQ